MKKNILIGLISILLVSCSNNNRKREYKEYMSADDSYSVSMPENLNKDNSIRDSVVSRNESIDKDVFLLYSNNLYSISYPKDWKYQEVNLPLMDVVFGKNNGDISFSIAHFPTEYSLNEANRISNEDLENGGANIISNKKITINGKLCYVTVFNLMQKQVSYIFKENGQIYSVKFTSPNDWMDKNKNIIDEIVRTFKIK